MQVHIWTLYMARASQQANLAIVPEELGDGGDDVRVVVAALEGVHRLAAPLRPRRHADSLRVQYP